LFLQTGDAPKVPAEDVKHEGFPLLVDVSHLKAEECKRIVLKLLDIQRQKPSFEFYFKVTEGAEERFKELPEWQQLCLIGDQTRLKKLPEADGKEIIDWLQKLSSEWNGQRVNAGSIRDIELIVDHFDKNGNALKNIDERIRRKEFKGKHLVFYICNCKPENFPEFLQLSKLALLEGEAKSVGFFTEGLQAIPAPLLTELMLRLQFDPHLTPAELLAKACREARERLERCLKEPDDGNLRSAFQREFRFFKGDPAKLFEEGSKLNRDKIDKIIKQLGLQEHNFVPVTLLQGKGVILV
jgi:hypothetical protein